MKKNRFFLTIIGVSMLLAACNHENIPFVESTEGDSESVQLSVHATKNGFIDKASTRTTTSGDFVTTFKSGDAIGVFVAKNGVILTDCNNIKLTYNENTGNWEGGNLYYHSGAEYYAYAPYRADMSGKSIEQIKTDFPYTADQSTPEKFVENDLLVSSACAANPTTRALQITFIHARGLLVFENINKAHFSYTSGTDPNFIYTLNNSSISKITLGGVENTTSISANGTLLYIIKLGDSPEIVADYTEDTNLLSYTALAGATSITAANTYQKITLTKSRDLAIGDFFYKDGSFYPGSTTENAPNQNDCVGVVAYLYKEGDPSNYIDGWRHSSTPYRRGTVVSKIPGNMTDWVNTRGPEVATFTNANLPLTSEAKTGGWLLPDQVELSYICSGVNEAAQWGKGTGLKDKLNPYITQAGGTAFENRKYLSNNAKYSGAIEINFTEGAFRYDSAKTGLYYVTLAF